MKTLIYVSFTHIYSDQIIKTEVLIIQMNWEEKQL